MFFADYVSFKLNQPDFHNFICPTIFSATSLAVFFPIDYSSKTEKCEFIMRLRISTFLAVFACLVTRFPLIASAPWPHSEDKSLDPYAKIHDLVERALTVLYNFGLWIGSGRTKTFITKIKEPENSG
jgi:hypothetical protein